MKVLTKLALSLALILGLACAGSNPGPPDQTYTLKGEIYQLPEAGSDEIYIRHEAIPHFVSSEGKVVGMDAMTMPFSLDPSLSLEGMAPETPVTFIFEVRWNGSPPFLITSLELREEEGEGAEQLPEDLENGEPGTESEEEEPSLELVSEEERPSE